MRLDLPFYLRLPSEIVLTWDPKFGVAAILPMQRFGEVAFSRSISRFDLGERLDPRRLLDSLAPPVDGPGRYNYTLTSASSKTGEEVPTLHIDTGPDGGFAELRGYTEIAVFVVVEQGQALSDSSKARALEVLNHFLDSYRLVTQDPYVHGIDTELHPYLVDYGVGTLPEHLASRPARKIFTHIGEAAFPKEIGEGRVIKLRTSFIESVFSGPTLPDKQLRAIFGVARTSYRMPLHYELVFTAQTELKRRNYHVAILEAETAFEVCVASALLQTAIAIGRSRDEVLQDMEDPRKLGLVSQRLRELDRVVAQYRVGKGLAAATPFCGSRAHTRWRADLYDLRNSIIHEAWRMATFQVAKAGIAACKAAMKQIEDRAPAVANRIQIDPGVDHLVETPGRLSF